MMMLSVENDYVFEKEPLFVIMNDVDVKKEEFRNFLEEIMDGIEDVVDDLDSEDEYEHLEYDMVMSIGESYNEISLDLEISCKFYEEEVVILENLLEDAYWNAFNNTPDLETHFYISI